MNALTFNDTTFNPIDRNGQIWLTSIEIAKALGYQNTKSVSNLYSNNSDEFSHSMTEVIESVTSLETKGLRKKVRIFSLRGCHLLAMFARTKIAKQFRKWVLDILDKEVGTPVQADAKLTAEQTLPLRNAVNKLVTKSGIMYPDGYKIVHQRFGVNHIKDLTLEQLSQAVEYVHDRILNFEAENKQTPLSNFTHNQYIMGVKHEIMDYVYALQRAVKANGGELPKYPSFNTEEVCRVFIASMISYSRMMLSFDHEGKPAIRFIPQEHAVVSRENLASVVEFADKSQLPSIISEAAKRLEN